MSKAIKKDKGKSRVDLINPRFILDLGNILAIGAEKYSEFNYREGEGLDRARLYAACMRHLLAYGSGIKNDKENGYSHLTAIASNVMMLYTLEEENKGKDFESWRFDVEKASKKDVRKGSKGRRSRKAKRTNKKTRKGE